MRGVDYYGFGMRDEPVRVRPRVTVRRGERPTAHNFEGRCETDDGNSGSLVRRDA